MGHYPISFNFVKHKRAVIASSIGLAVALLLILVSLSWGSGEVRTVVIDIGRESTLRVDGSEIEAKTGASRHADPTRSSYVLRLEIGSHDLTVITPGRFAEHYTIDVIDDTSAQAYIVADGKLTRVPRF